MDRDLWAELAAANLLGLCLAERDGGSGYGILEAVVVLEELGRAVAPVPFLETVVLAGTAVAELGTDEQRARWLPGVVDGSCVLTAALQEPVADPLAPLTTARPDGGEWRLDGEKIAVPWGPLAEAVVVPATTGDGSARLFLVTPDARGLAVERTESTHRQPQLNLTLDGAAAEALGEGGHALRDLHRRALAGLCALAVGAFTEAVRITAAYVREREQFGKPIAAFQLTQQKLTQMAAGLSTSLLLALHLGRRKDAGGLAPAQVSLGKLHNVRQALAIARQARTILGANGISLAYPVLRHANNLESVLTYEGTEEIHTLVLGEAITGLGAFRPGGAGEPADR
jgi:glutaryl-CoA dehydrogenase